MAQAFPSRNIEFVVVVVGKFSSKLSFKVKAVAVVVVDIAMAMEKCQLEWVSVK